MNQNGFTIKELIMAFVVMGLLFIIAVPQYFYLKNSQRQSQMEQVLAELEIQIAKQKDKLTTNDQGYFILDNAPIQQPCQTCFSLVKENGINNPLWYKLSNAKYLFSRNGNSGSVENYQESGDFSISFEKTGKISIVQKN